MRYIKFSVRHLSCFLATAIATEGQKGEDGIIVDESARFLSPLYVVYVYCLVFYIYLKGCLYYYRFLNLVLHLIYSDSYS